MTTRSAAPNAPVATPPVAMPDAAAAPVIEVRRQHRMSPRETWRLCIRSVKHRLFRSALTLAVVVLAVAFFEYLLASSFCERAVAGAVAARDAEARASERLLARIVSPATEAVCAERLAEADAAAAAGDSRQLAECAAVSALPQEHIAELARQSTQFRTYSAWFAEMPVGKRLVLAGKRTGRDALRFVAADREALRANLGMMLDLRVPGGADALESFLDSMPGWETALADFAKRWNRAVTAAAQSANAAVAQCRESGRASAPATLERWLAAPSSPPSPSIAPPSPSIAPQSPSIAPPSPSIAPPSPRQLDGAALQAAPAAGAGAPAAWRASVEKLGFDFPPDKLVKMRRDIAAALEDADLLDALSHPDVRQEWATAFRKSGTGTAEEKLAQIDDPRAAPLLEKIGFTRESARAVAARRASARRIAALREALSPVLRVRPAAFGLTGRQLFLLAISFFVCMVGIANAMLMAIAERFREIATMKCLGATDGCILAQFMMEAAMQGFFGGLLGTAAGFCIAVAKCAALYGSLVWSSFPGPAIAAGAAASVLSGVMLSALASIQPAWSASRMAPMEAMRVE